MPIDRPGDTYKNKRGLDRDQWDQMEGSPDAQRGKWGNQQYVEGEQRIGEVDGGSILNPLRAGADMQTDALAEAQAGRGMGTLQLKQGLGAAAMQQAAMGAGGGPMAQRAAMMAGAGQASQGVNQAAMMRQQEMAAGRAGVQGALQAEAGGATQLQDMGLRRDTAQAAHHAAMADQNRLQLKDDREFGTGVAGTALSAIGTVAMLSDPKLKGAYSPAGAKEGFLEGRAIGEGRAPSPTSNAVRPMDIDDSLAMLSEFDRQDAATEGGGYGLEDATGAGLRAVVANTEERKMREGRALYPEETGRQAEARLDSELKAKGAERAAQEAYISKLAARPPEDMKNVVHVDRERGFNYLKPGTTKFKAQELKSNADYTEAPARKEDDDGKNPYDLSDEIKDTGGQLKGAMESDPKLKKGLKADSTMEDLDTYHYEYKPEYQKRLGLPDGHRIGVMADELEDTPLGEAAVRDTEEGKVIDRDNYLFGVVTPGLARLHERLEALEKKKGRR